MVFRRLIGLVFAGGLVFSAAAADIVVHIAPPHIRVERRSRRPGADYVWVSGYHRWENNAYAWTPGRWSNRLGRTPTGWRIAGLAGKAAGSWWKATGGSAAT